MSCEIDYKKVEMLTRSSSTFSTELIYGSFNLWSSIGVLKIDGNLVKKYVMYQWQLTTPKDFIAEPIPLASGLPVDPELFLEEA